jgi:FKBP-type peptidyl-prolyl cis-trans isomerase FkpA
MTRLTLIALSLALATGAAHAAEMTEDQKTLYAVGQVMARQTAVFQLTPAELDVVQQGWRDGALGGKSAVDMSVYGPKVNELVQARQAAAAQQGAAKGKEVLAKAAAEKGAVKAPGGFVYRALTEGSGARPAASDVVKVHYRGTLPDGTEFDSSYKRNEPTEFPLDGVIKCWTEGVAMMKVGGKAQLTCPPETAYGDRGAGGVIPPGATLVFEIELLEVNGK